MLHSWAGKKLSQLIKPPWVKKDYTICIDEVGLGLFIELEVLTER